jgi:hypothetical protein
MVKAGWIKETVASREGVVIHYTDKGTLLMKPLAKLSRPFSDYLKGRSKRKPSILARLVFVFRIWKVRQELSPPALTEAEFYKLVALAVRTAPTDGPG